MRVACLNKTALIARLQGLYFGIMLHPRLDASSGATAVGERPNALKPLVLIPDEAIEVLRRTYLYCKEDTKSAAVTPGQESQPRRELEAVTPC